MRAIKAYTKSSSFIVSFVFMALLFVGVAFNTYVLTVSNDKLLIRETEAAILADIGGFRSLYTTSGRHAVIKAIEERSKDVTNNFYYHFRDAQGNYIAGSLASWPGPDVELIQNGLLNIKVRFRDEFKDENVSEDTAAIAMLVEFENKDSLLVARSVQQYEFAVSLAHASSWVMIIIVCIISVLSIGVAYYVVSRINLIADTAENIIQQGNLSERLYVESEWDDLSKLAMSLNQLLDQVEKSINGIRSVSDNIAHDLRTPLTRLKSRIEKLPENDQKKALMTECDNILGIFNSLLRITYIETNAKKAGFKCIELAEVLEDAIDLYSPIIEEKAIQLTVDIGTQTSAFCDKSLMFQVFANVIDNAVKFTPNNQKIAIDFHKNNDQLEFSVTDSGVGVPDEALDKLTRRFYRTEKSRTTAGNGLGLALVEAVISLHKGVLTFSRGWNEKGLRCSIVIPFQAL